jgi:hypothetical protein
LERLTEDQQTDRAPALEVLRRIFSEFAVKTRHVRKQNSLLPEKGEDPRKGEGRVMNIDNAMNSDVAMVNIDVAMVYMQPYTMRTLLPNGLMEPLFLTTGLGIDHTH